MTNGRSSTHLEEDNTVGSSALYGPVFVRSEMRADAMRALLAHVPPTTFRPINIVDKKTPLGKGKVRQSCERELYFLDYIIPWSKWCRKYNFVYLFFCLARHCFCLEYCRLRSKT